MATTHPDRIASARAHAAQRDSFIALAEHPAAVMCYPRTSNGADGRLEDLSERGVVAMVVTAYLLGDAAQWKAVKGVLEDYKLLGGPVRTDTFGNQLRPLRWNGPAVFDEEFSARLTHDSDDWTMFLQQAIAPGRYLQHQDSYGRPSQMPAEPVGSHVIPLDDGEWKGGDLLSTPRDKLPELLAADVSRLISDVEAARWGSRPALQREAAA